jgi:hypothetical protein
MIILKTLYDIFINISKSKKKKIIHLMLYLYELYFILGKLNHKFHQYFKRNKLHMCAYF